MARLGSNRNVTVIQAQATSTVTSTLSQLLQTKILHRVLILLYHNQQNQGHHQSTGLHHQDKLQAQTPDMQNTNNPDDDPNEDREKIERGFFHFRIIQRRPLQAIFHNFVAGFTATIAAKNRTLGDDRMCPRINNVHCIPLQLAYDVIAEIKVAYTEGLIIMKGGLMAHCHFVHPIVSLYGQKTVFPEAPDQLSLEEQLNHQDAQVFKCIGRVVDRLAKCVSSSSEFAAKSANQLDIVHLKYHVLYLDVFIFHKNTLAPLEALIPYLKQDFDKDPLWKRPEQVY
jgi:hypothetical protein